MMRDACAPHTIRMHALDAIRMRNRCNVTGRYGTERKNHQDPEENLSVSYPPKPVDNPVFDRRRGAR